MANGMFKKKTDIDSHSSRLMPNSCQHLDPPYTHYQLPLSYKTFGTDMLFPMLLKNSSTSFYIGSELYVL
jgi:hypothetical protein